MPLSPAKARELSISLSSASDSEAAALAGKEVLEFLQQQLAALREQVAGYPWSNRSIEDPVWDQGRELTFVCDEVADTFAARGLPVEEERAAGLALAMSRPIFHAYRNQTYPRILRHARCREAVGEVEAAIHGFEVIVADFRSCDYDFLLENAERFSEEFLGVFSTVDTAAQRLIELRPPTAASLRRLQTSLQRFFQLGMAE